MPNLRLRPAFAIALAAFALFVAMPASASAQTPSDDDDIGSYGLDDASREVSPKGRLVCPKVPLVTYAGEHVRYAKPLRIYEGFRTRLERFEQVLVKVATEIYGRPPTRIRHIGTYNCRRIGRYPHLVSEHGMGNGIDVSGFTFGALPRGATAPEGLPKALRRGFTVKVLDHWDGERGTAAVHARFLRALTDALVARRDIFRVLLGPAYPGHKDHFHFDCAPYRLVVL